MSISIKCHPENLLIFFLGILLGVINIVLYIALLFGIAFITTKILNHFGIFNLKELLNTPLQWFLFIYLLFTGFGKINISKNKK